MGCNDEKGNGVVHTGVVEGTVYLPFDLSAALQPAAGVSVRLSGEDYSKTRLTPANGSYEFDDAPEGTLTLEITPSECFADSQISVAVTADDTSTIDVTLRVSVEGDCIALPFAGAARMEIEPASNRAVLLYDDAEHANPAIVVVDLSTGDITTREMPDIANAFDLDFVSTNQVVFNCLKTGSGHFLRFVNLTTLANARADVMYTPNTGSLAGKIVATPSGADVFVTHRVQAGFEFDGQIFCIDVAQGAFTDADNDVFNGNFAFDSNLVGGSVNWPYNIAFDAGSGELLVGNYRDTLVIAIDLSFWGDFDRDANLQLPTPGVRKIVMGAGVPGFAPWFWHFDGDRGVAGWPGSGQAPMLAYQSGGNTYHTRLVEQGVALASSNHHLAIHPARNSWYTIIDDASRPQSGRKAVEERSLVTLERISRFETSFTELPTAEPRAFAVNTQTNRLYVAYNNKSLIEVFPLPVNP